MPTGWEPHLPVAWNEDLPADLPVIEANLRALLNRIAANASRREPPTVAMAQDWHRDTYRTVELPVPYFAGEIRDSDASYPELYGYEVRVGTTRGVSSERVPQELVGFETRMSDAVAKLDSAIQSGSRPTDQEELRSVLTLCAFAHGE